MHNYMSGVSAEKKSARKCNLKSVKRKAEGEQMMSLDAGKIYDELPEGAKNLSREEFVSQVNRLTSPALMQRDLKATVTHRQVWGVNPSCQTR